MLCANAAHEKLSEKLLGLTPSSRSTPAASSPCRGPLTKKRAPFRGFEPGSRGRSSGLAGSRVAEYGSAQSCCPGCTTNARGPRAEELDAEATPTVAANASATSAAPSSSRLDVPADIRLPPVLSE